jgi:NAD+ kinase
MTRIGIIAHAGKVGARRLLRALIDEFGCHRGITVVLEARTAELIKAPAGIPAGEVGDHVDILLVLGGDGTILQVLHDSGSRVKPIFGINLGSLGFLTCVNSSNYLKAVESVVKGDFNLSSRTLLELELQRGQAVVARRIALNDAVISRGEVSRLIRLETRIDGDVLTEYNADGLIIATPTGSTAYSLSAGGPVLAPDSGVFVVTPICPHVLTNRSVVVSDASVISVEPRRNRGPVFLTVDGKDFEKVRGSDRVVIRKSAQTLELAMLPGMSFSEVLRQKLKWSGTAL